MAVMTCRQRLEAYLHEQQATFDVQQHRVAYTAEQIAATEGIRSKLVAKSVMVFADGRLTMLVLPASCQVDLARAHKVLGAKSVRMADESEFATFFPDCEVGTMPPFGNLYGIPVYVDARLTHDAFIVFPAGSYTETMRMPYQDFARLVHPIVGEFAVPKDVYVS